VDFMVRLDGGAVRGEDTGGDGVPVVLLHPGWGDSTIWDAVCARLPASSRVIRYDERGFGRSPAPTGPFTAASDLAAVLDERGVEDAVVVGHSGGGATAVSLALAQPQRLRSLLLVAPGVSGYPWPVDDPYFSEFDALFDAGDRDGLVALGLSAWAASGTDPRTEEQVRSAVAGMFAQGDLLREDPPAYDRLGEVRVPAEVVVGDRDHPMVVACAGKVGAAIPGCRTTTLPGVDHMVPLRAPTLLAELIAARLS
jgi:3-oxoadipate enol-lactonase